MKSQNSLISSIKDFYWNFAIIRRIDLLFYSCKINNSYHCNLYFVISNKKKQFALIQKNHKNNKKPQELFKNVLITFEY